MTDGRRKVKEWIGASPDTPIPPRVRVRVFEKYEGRCYRSNVRLLPGMWDIDHIVAIINGGENRESNLAPIWNGRAHKEKTREDVKIKAATYRKKKYNIGLRKKSRFPGSRDSKWKKKLDGTIVKR
jgi:5-methylcytosine-specific restriction protein A